MNIKTTLGKFEMRILRRLDETGMLDIAGDVNAMETLTTLVSDVLDCVDKSALETTALVVDGADTIH
jgi:hypothetical protein